jgi:hypothetical protein
LIETFHQDEDDNEYERAWRQSGRRRRRSMLLMTDPELLVPAPELEPFTFRSHCNCNSLALQSRHLCNVLLFPCWMSTTVRTLHLSEAHCCTLFLTLVVSLPCFSRAFLLLMQLLIHKICTL